MEPPCLAFTGGGAPLGAHYCLSVSSLSVCTRVYMWCVCCCMYVIHCMMSSIYRERGHWFGGRIFLASLHFSQQLCHLNRVFTTMPVHSRLKILLEFSVEAAIFKRPPRRQNALECNVFTWNWFFCEAAVRESNDIHAGLDKAAKPMDSSVFFHIVVAHWVPLGSAFCYWQQMCSLSKNECFCQITQYNTTKSNGTHNVLMQRFTFALILSKTSRNNLDIFSSQTCSLFTSVTIVTWEEHFKCL